MATVVSRPSLPLQPTTPRTPQRINQNGTFTPRSSRRQTGGGGPTSTPGPSRFYPPPHTFDPLPPLSLKPFPTKLYPTTPSLLQILDNDKESFAYTLDNMSRVTSDRQQSLNEYITEVDEEVKRIELSMKELEGQASGWSEINKREREEAEGMREREKEVEQRKRGLRVQIEERKADINEVKEKLKARRELKDAQRTAFHHQTSQNAPELAFFESKLGLKIRSLGRDRILFKFTNIDPVSYNRIFSFEVDVSKPQYSVSLSSPPSFLPKETLDSLVNKLNLNRDLYGFFIEVRKALKEEVGRERERARG